MVEPNLVGMNMIYMKDNDNNYGHDDDKDNDNDDASINEEYPPKSLRQPTLSQVIAPVTLYSPH